MTRHWLKTHQENKQTRRKENKKKNNFCFDTQEVPAFRDFRIRDPRHFVIWFQALNSWNPLYFVIWKKNCKKIYFFGIFFPKISYFCLLFCILKGLFWHVYQVIYYKLQSICKYFFYLRIFLFRYQIILLLALTFHILLLQSY